MINFFKRLFGLTAEPTAPTETVREILTPPARVELPPAAPVVEAPKASQLAQTNNKKVRAISEPAKANKPAPKHNKARPKTKPQQANLKQSPANPAKPKQSPKK